MRSGFVGWSPTTSYIKLQYRKLMTNYRKGFTGVVALVGELKKDVVQLKMAIYKG